MADKSRRGLVVQKECVSALPVHGSDCPSIAETIVALADAVIELRQQIAFLEYHFFYIRLQMRDDCIRLPTVPFDQ